MQRHPDINQATERLGWEPRVNLADGLKPTIRYFRKILSGQDR
jgi:UDP-glucuronate decarboxylase